MIHRIETIEAEREKVLSRIGDLKLEVCPSCHNETLYPMSEKWQAMNPVSRTLGIYICNLCGDAEAFSDFNS